MIFGIPRELKDHETRVGAGLIPRNVATLIAQGKKLKKSWPRKKHKESQRISSRLFFASNRSFSIC